MQRVVIVIPVYKHVIDDYEKISLRQLKRVLGNYPCVFILPKSLNVFYGNDYANFMEERFDDKFFQGTRSYSELLLSEEFYKRFKDYDYMLIYQLDAFVFADKLQDFCKLGYDYIGAPVQNSKWMQHGMMVGNGGFSLRKIQSCLRVVEAKKSIISERRLRKEIRMAEDMFFAYCGIRKDVDFSVPDYHLAEQFSMDSSVLKSFFRQRQTLPFGCHGWSTHNLDYWYPRIEKCNFKLFSPPRVVPTADYLKKVTIRDYLFLRMQRNKKRFAKAVQAILKTQHIQLRGFGEWGRNACDWLKNAGVDIKGIYDNRFVRPHVLYGRKYAAPDGDWYVGIPVLISIQKYEQEIADNLSQKGLAKNRDYFLYSEVIWEVIRAYYCGERTS